MATLSKHYDPENIEQRWRATWAAAPEPKQAHGAPYCIMLPPPNVTGSLHMGHGFQITLMDVLIRKHRMEGRQVHWQVGSDHAGIATQMVVERQLNQEGKTRHDLGRKTFIERVWDWKATSGGRIMQQIRRLGASVDWSSERFSMDEGMQAAVRTAFIKLYREDKLYRGKRLVHWDPILKTALSDLEVINKPEEGSMWYMRYPLAHNEGHMVVATTRPETMLGDVAVAVHPDDARYQHMIGQTLKLPLTERCIPIIADAEVDPEFGTGCVKITPAHDFNDYAMGKRHTLPIINILDERACLNEQTPQKYQGLSCSEARTRIVADLDTLGLLEKTEKHTLQKPYGDRSGAVVEPRLTDQWFVQATALAPAAMEAVQDGRLNFLPEHWQKTYMQWLENIEDWCVSRQLWWGHRIPAWFDNEGKHYVGESEQEVRAHYKLGGDIPLKQDEDVLDTWFSAALWPFGTLGWPEETAMLERFYPTQVLMTGFDIIFFWVARMVMFGLYFTGKVPFSEVYITGLIRDNEGQKMSKSKGNVLDPIDLIDGIDLDDLVQKRTHGLMQPKMQKTIEKNTKKHFPEGIRAHGTDALRYTFCALATTGRDINFGMNRLEGYTFFCNKIWNAARFVFMHTETHTPRACESQAPADLWIHYALQQCTNRMHDAFASYRFDLASQCLYDFIWNQYCDWYLELAKQRLQDDAVSDDAKNATRYTMLATLEYLCRLMHPLMPFISAEIRAKLHAPLECAEPNIMLAPYPQRDGMPLSQQHREAADACLWLQGFVNAVRSVRTQLKVPHGKKITVLLAQAQQEDHKQTALWQTMLQRLAKIESIRIMADDECPPEAATHMLGRMEIHIPLEGLIDVEAEKTRLDKTIAKQQAEVDKLTAKLQTERFIQKAPPAVVAKERARLKEISLQLATLQAQRSKLGSGANSE